MDPFFFERNGRTFTLHRRDCIAGMRDLLSPKSVDVIVTSPPYNLGVKYGRYDDSLPREQYLDWIESWAQIARRVLQDKGSLFLNIGAKPTDPWGPFEVLLRLRRHFVLQNVIHWIKSIAIDAQETGRSTGVSRNMAVGHYKPINSPRYVNDCHEYIFHLTKTGDVALDRLAVGVEYQDKSNIDRWRTKASKDLRCRGNTWFASYRTIKSRDKQRPHPATFPVKIPRMCILLHGAGRTQLVLDPFLGLGHTALACKELDISFVGFEIDQDYFRLASALLGTHKGEGRSQEPAGAPQLPLFEK